MYRRRHCTKLINEHSNILSKLLVYLLAIPTHITYNRNTSHMQMFLNPIKSKLFYYHHRNVLTITVYMNSDF